MHSLFCLSRVYSIGEKTWVVPEQWAQCDLIGNGISRVTKGGNFHSTSLRSPCPRKEDNPLCQVGSRLGGVQQANPIFLHVGSLNHPQDQIKFDLQHHWH